MRIFLFINMLICFAAANAQTVSPFGAVDYSQSAGYVNNMHSRDSVPMHKWFFSAYRGMSTGISFFRGGSATFITAPIGLQLNRRLSNNFMVLPI